VTKNTHPKQTLITSFYLATALLAAFSATATNVEIGNSNFDAQPLADNTSSSRIQNWYIEQGLGGVFNPTEGDFSEEADNGKHQNLLYLLDDSKASQVLTANVLPNANYVLRFDVGERANVSLTGYSVVVKAADKVLLNATNPQFPESPGSFAAVELTFDTQTVDPSLLTIEFASLGDGHAFFDNVSLSYTQTIKESVFGEWEVISARPDFAIGEPQVAESDGFLSLRTLNYCSSHSDFFQVKLPDGSWSGWIARAWQYDSFLVPISKNETWRIYRNKEGPDCIVHVFFKPLK